MLNFDDDNDNDFRAMDNQFRRMDEQFEQMPQDHATGQNETPAAGLLSAAPQENPVKVRTSAHTVSIVTTTLKSAQKAAAERQKVRDANDVARELSQPPEQVNNESHPNSNSHAEAFPYTQPQPSPAENLKQTGGQFSASPTDQWGNYAQLPYAAGMPSADSLAQMHAATANANIYLQYNKAKKSLEDYQIDHYEKTVIYTAQHALYNGFLGSLDPMELPPEAPLDVLSEPARKFVLEMSYGNPTRQVLAFSSLFALFPAATQGTYEIQYSNGNDHKHAFTSYVVAAAPSGAGKSDIMTTYLKPFADYEDKLAAESDQEISDVKKLQNSLTIKALQKKADKIIELALAETDDIEAARNDSLLLIECIQSLKNENNQKPIHPRILTDSVTIPELPFLLGKRGAFTFIADAEASILQEIKSRNANILLKGFGGERFERNLREDETRLKSPVITLLLFMQKSKLEDFVKTKNLENLGLMARILPVIAPPPIAPALLPENTQMSASSKASISEASMNWYCTSIVSTLETATAKKKCGKERTIVKLSSSADYAVNNWHRNLCVHEGKVSEGYGYFLDRIRQHLLNLAMSLHLMDGIPDDHEISVGTIERAIKVVMFFSHYTKILLDPKTFRGKANAEKILKWFEKNQISSFRGRHAYWATHLKADDAWDALAILERAGYVQQCNVPDRGACAKEGRIWVVNPRIVPGSFAPPPLLSSPSPYQGY